jgi:hypothetical protein
MLTIGTGQIFSACIKKQRGGNMLKKNATTAAWTAALSLLFVMPAAAVTDGELDGDRHPYVGLMVAQDAGDNPLWRCSGTLLSPKIFLTAGHCTEFPAAHVEIWFDADVESGIPANGYPFTGEVSGTPHVHPQYDPNRFFLHDLGVVVLENSVYNEKNEYGILPTLDQLDTLKTRRGKQDVTFTAVGYGLQESFPNAASWKENNQRVRMTARPHLLQINTPGFTGDFSNAAFQQSRHRRHLLRRLRRPELHRRFQRDRRCHIIWPQRQLRRHRRRLPG